MVGKKLRAGGTGKHLSSQIISDQLSLFPRGRQIIPNTIITCPFRILRPSVRSERRNDMNEGRHDRKAYSDSVRILNLRGI